MLSGNRKTSLLFRQISCRLKKGDAHSIRNWNILSCTVLHLDICKWWKKWSAVAYEELSINRLHRLHVFLTQVLAWEQHWLSAQLLPPGMSLEAAQLLASKTQSVLRWTGSVRPWMSPEGPAQAALCHDPRTPCLTSTTWGLVHAGTAQGNTEEEEVGGCRWEAAANYQQQPSWGRTNVKLEDAASLNFPIPGTSGGVLWEGNPCMDAMV